MDIHPSPPIASSSNHVPHQHSKKRRPSTSEDKNGGASRRREEGGEGRKRARPLPPPPFPHAQRISLNDISQDTPASEDHFVSGKVVDVRQWSQEKMVVTLFIADDSTPQPLKIFLKGSWVERAPKADGSRPSFAILLRGLKWETAGGIGGTRKYAAVFEEGAVFQLRDEVFDGFAAATKIATKQNQAPTGALKTTGPQSPSSLQVPPSNQVASSVAPPPASLHPPSAHARSTSPTNPSSAEISASAPPLQLPHSTSIPTKRPRSPSSPSPSSKRVAPSGLPAFPPSDSPIDEDTSHAPINSLPPPPKPSRAQAPTLEQPESFVATPLPSPISPTKLPSFTIPGPPPPVQPSTILPNAPHAPPPHPHSPMRVIITTHVLKFDPHLVSDDQLLQRVVDGLIGLPETIWRGLLLSDEGFDRRVKQIKARLLQEAEEEETREQREEGAKAASRVDATRRDEEGGGLGVVRVEKEVVRPAVPEKESVVQQRVEGRPSDPSHQPLQLLHQPTLLASPPQAFPSTLNLATPSIPTRLSPLKPVAVQPHPDDAPGPSRSRHSQALQPPQSLHTSAQSQQYEKKEEEDEDITLHKGFETTTPKFRYFCISDVKKQPLNRPTACVGMVSKITGPTKSSKDYYMIITLQDSTGTIDFKVFEGSRSHLPPVKINDVLLIRDTPIKKFRETFELVGGSRDKHTWTFFDSEFKTVVVQPNRLAETRDLADIEKIDPSIRIYGTKLSRWVNSSGGRIERLQQGDVRLLELTRRRERHVKRGVELQEQERGEAPEPPSPPRPLLVRVVVVPPPNEAPMEVDDRPRQLPSPLPSSVEAAPSTISIPGPSRALPSDASMGLDVVGLPSVKGKERERVSPFSRRARFEAESSERMVDRPEDEVSPTQAIFYDKQHPNGTSLLEILLTDRAKFRTRARIVDFAPKALEDVVVASCDRCDIDLPSSDKRCRTCNDITGHFTAWRYRLVFVLSDGTASLKAAVFDGEDMLTLFPNLPPASEFANSPTSPMEYLETQIEKLVGKMDSPSSTSTRREGPLLDLSLRKFRADVRGVPGIGKEGWAWSYRVFQTVIR